MKRGDYLTYKFFETIEHDCELAKFFNKVFNSLHLARIVSAPEIFEEDEHFKGKKKKNYDRI